jgi:AraC family transcriptional regulator
MMNGPVAVNDVALRCVCSRLYSEFRQPDELAALAIEGLGMELMAGLLRESVREPVKKAPLWLRRAEEIIRSRFADRLALVDIAEAAGIHPVHLAREFRRFYGSTLGQYVRQRRIEYAIGLISKAGSSFADIALAAGFSDQSHFSRTFRKLTGLTPRQFRTVSHQVNPDQEN